MRYIIEVFWKRRKPLLATCIIGKIHTIHLATDAATLLSVLDIVERMIGPNILLHNVTYIIKEPKAKRMSAGIRI